MNVLIEIVTPIFGLVAVGYGAARLGYFEAARLRGLSYFAFAFAIPALLLRSMAQIELTGALAWPFLASYYLSAFTIYAAGMAVSRLTFGHGLRGGAIGGFTASFSNTVLLGIPIVLTVFGERATLPVFLIVAFHSLLMFPIATVMLEFRGGRGLRFGDLARSTLGGLARNPILIGLVIGLTINILQLDLPTALDSLLEMLGRAAVPVALFAMGASLHGYGIRGPLPESITLVGLKLVLHPLLVWSLGRFVFELDPLWLQVAVIVAALPAGVNAYILAQRYETLPAVAASSILIGTAVSVATISALLLLWSPI